MDQQLHAKLLRMIARHEEFLRRAGLLLAAADRREPFSSDVTYHEEELSSLDANASDLAVELFGSIPTRIDWCPPVRFAYAGYGSKNTDAMWWMRQFQKGLRLSKRFFESFLPTSESDNQPQEKARLPTTTTHYHQYFGEIHMGDVFQGINNSTIVSRSQVEGAFNRLQDNGQGESAKLLVELGQRVADANNLVAGGVYRQMVEELSKPDQDKGVLKSCWSGLVAILPPLASLTAEVIKVFAI